LLLKTQTTEPSPFLHAKPPNPSYGSLEPFRVKHGGQTSLRNERSVQAEQSLGMGEDFRGFSKATLIMDKTGLFSREERSRSSTTER